MKAYRLAFAAACIAALAAVVAVAFYVGTSGATAPAVSSPEPTPAPVVTPTPSPEPPVTAPAPAPKPSATTYVTKKGDTLWSLAKRFYGDPKLYPAIYEANKAAIEASAKRHRHANAAKGDWLFQGMVLTIPANPA